ncbi:hypothetical protein GCK72_020708 [Caenorhabditis remanei]|uniref:ShKT domain-containing protein n=1 Tax=Caenorhabditis remanei TaxID=31234 RepID=A0A6A5GG10_CAERE|nr:hypothetical protein GCK72_020708 [Caenorhabditis remanei]KAF1754148.1 hypothetical protein GCK72_020708 [Caenorhabditis remanei]
MIGFLTILAFTTSGAFAIIADDFSCSSGGVYTSGATSCSNNMADASCAVFYKESAPGVGYPAAGNSVQRPFACYTTGNAPGPINEDLRKMAITNCPKTCGFCCATSAFNCTNVQFPRINCATIQPSQCLSSIWRETIAQDCPSACGFCNEGGCVDAVTDCAVSMCNQIDFQEFVNQNCKRTCARCGASPSNPSNPPAPCNSYPVDTSSSCAAWANNGFCKNDFYKDVVRQYCATTCKVC